MALTLSENDRRLLNRLQRDAKAPVQELAEDCGMSASACWRRIRQFEEAGLITHYAALLEPEAVGLGFSAIVQVSVVRHERDYVQGFLKAIQPRPEVLECYATTGDADYHMKVLCRDKADYNRFLEECILRVPGLSQVRTNLILHTVKATTQVAL